MKKLIVLLMVLLLTVALVGCGNEWKSWSDVFPEEQTQYYTQEEVDELIQNAIDELGEEIENDIPQQYYSKDEVDQLIQDQIDELELRIEYLESLIEVDDDGLLTETFYEELTHMTMEYVVENGVGISMTICELYDDECETNYLVSEEQSRLYINSDRESIISGMKSYLEMLEGLFDYLNG